MSSRNAAKFPLVVWKSSAAARFQHSRRFDHGADRKVENQHKVFTLSHRTIAIMNSNKKTNTSYSGSFQLLRSSITYTAYSSTPAQFRRSSRTYSKTRSASSYSRIPNTSGASPELASNGNACCGSTTVGLSFVVSPASFASVIPKEPCPEPAEDVIDDRLRIRHLLVAGPTARLKPNMAELIHKELQRDTVLQAIADRSRQAYPSNRKSSILPSPWR